MTITTKLAVTNGLVLADGITGFPNGEPCKHQHAVANKYKLNSPNLIPCFNARGRYLHAVVKTFYAKRYSC